MRKTKKNNVVSMRGALPDAPSVQCDVVEDLEELLELARAGQVLGLVWGAVMPTGNRTSWCGAADQHRLSSAAAMLNYRVHKAMEENME